MNDPWLDNFTQSFSTPSPKEDFILKVQHQMHNAMQQQKEAVRPKISLFVVLTLATVPLFFLINYAYYSILHAVITNLFPQMLTSFFILFFVSVSFAGAICYGLIPIWIARSYHQGFFHSSQFRHVKI